MVYSCICWIMESGHVVQFDRRENKNANHGESNLRIPNPPSCNGDVNRILTGFSTWFVAISTFSYSALLLAQLVLKTRQHLSYYCWQLYYLYANSIAGSVGVMGKNIPCLRQPCGKDVWLGGRCSAFGVHLR